jgi:hypothetical protein
MQELGSAWIFRRVLNDNQRYNTPDDIVKDKIREWYNLVSRGLDTKILTKGKSADEIRQKLEKERGFKCNSSE